ncbi:MAG: hypothetical protein HYY01_14600 [Chloroflexi bacterium]|nr:hypothetical protein [Chloroflexota bacterium]
MARTPELAATKRRRPGRRDLTSGETASLPLPRDLKPLFWDVEFRRLRWPRDRDFITGRVLAEGGYQHTRWLTETAGKGAIREWVIQRRGRGLSARTLRFWEVVLDLSHRQVTAWIAEQLAYPWSSRLAR